MRYRKPKTRLEEQLDREWDLAAREAVEGRNTD